MVFKWLRRSRGPETLIGQYLHAAASRKPTSLVDPIRAELDRTKWYDAETVAQPAFEFVVREAYRPGNPVMDVPDLVQTMRKHFGRDGVDKFPQDHGEILVRAALGEDVPVDEIDKVSQFVVFSLIFMGLVFDLVYTEAELDEMLVRAEEMAFARGHSPTLASSRRHKPNS